MLKVLFFLFIAVPLVELWLLFELASLIEAFTVANGAWIAILYVVLTGIVGYWFARAQGWKAYQQIRRSFEKRRNPTESLVDGLLVLVAGVLLMTPGMLTDLVGFLLLVPLSRAVFRRWLIRYFSRRLKTVVMEQLAPSPGGVEEGVFEGVVVERDFRLEEAGEPDDGSS